MNAAKRNAERAREQEMQVRELPRPFSALLPMCQSSLSNAASAKGGGSALPAFSFDHPPFVIRDATYRAGGGSGDPMAKTLPPPLSLSLSLSLPLSPSLSLSLTLSLSLPCPLPRALSLFWLDSRELTPPSTLLPTACSLARTPEAHGGPPQPSEPDKDPGDDQPKERPGQLRRPDGTPLFLTETT